MADPIDRYVRTLRSELRFDPVLAERVCAEVEEHLVDLVEAEGQREGAEQRAVERMGNAGRLAAELAIAAMPGRLKLTWQTVALSALAVFLAMRLRNMLMPVDPAELDATALALAIDRFAYWGALLVGVTGWLYVRPGRAVMRSIRALAPVYLCAGALTVSSVAGFYLLASTLATQGWSSPMTAPLLATAAEVAVLYLVFRELHGLARHARSAGRQTAPL